MVLNPESSITRAQLSVVLMRFDEWMKQAPVLPE
jgi:hypothetical protein